MNIIKWMQKEETIRKQRIDKAFAAPNLQPIIAELGLTLEDIKEVDRRIQMLGISERGKRKAMRDPEILKDLFRRLDPQRNWGMEDYLDWSSSVIDKYG